MSLPTAIILSMEAQYTKNGVLYDPSPAPTVTDASYPDGTVLAAGLPITMTHVRTGVYTANVFTALQSTLVGTYQATANTSDATVDQLSGNYPWAWPDVGVNNVTAGSIATVTGNVNGNVTGSVGSVLGNVAGSVASVVGNVGGNVVGSVNSVVTTVAANLTQILGAALTETAGQLAAGFKKLFNVAVPTMDMTNVNQTGDSYARLGAPAGASIDADILTRSTYAGADTAGTTTLLGRLTAGRAGFLDNLNVGGAVASHADILAINQSASRNVVLITVSQYEQPSSGTETFTVEARLYSTSGAPVNADSTPTLTATGAISGNLSANLSAATNFVTGGYRWTYTVHSTDALEQIRMDISATISAVVYTLSAYTQVVEDVSATFNATDRTHLTGVFNALPSRTYLAGSASSDGDVVADVQTGLTNQGYTGARAVKLDDLDATVSSRATDAHVLAIPTTPVLTAHFDTITGTPAASVSADIAAVKAQTNGIAAIPTNPLLTSDARLNDLDATISSRATDAHVLAIPTTPLLTGDARLNDLDAAISSRLATSGYVAPDNADIAAIKVKSDQLTFTVANHVDATASGGGGGITTGFSGAAATQINDIQAKADTIADPWLTILPGPYTGAEAGAILAAVQARLATISGTTVPFVSPIGPNGQVVGPCIIGDSFLAVDGRNFVFNLVGYPAINGSAVYSVSINGTPILTSIPATILSTTSISLEMTHAQSALMSPSYAKFDAVVTRTDGSRITVVLGQIEFVAGVTP